MDEVVYPQAANKHHTATHLLTALPRRMGERELEA